MTKRPSVREARTEDAIRIQEVARASWHAAYDSIIGRETVTALVNSWFDPTKLDSDDIRPAERPFFVAEIEGEVVGVAEGLPGDDEKTFHLYRIYVLPEQWGEQIGSTLLERVESETRVRSGTHLRLSVFTANDIAVHFYESRGFERIETTTDETFNARRHRYRKALENKSCRHQ
ncbi:GNAT family N-acetyltransferase [Saliphagus sp. GCM10025334]